MDYVVVFDVTGGGYRKWRTLAFGSAFVVVGFVLPLMRRRFALELPTAALFIAGSFLCTTSFFALTFFSYKASSDALQQGRCQVIEEADHRL